ncbi:MAG: hypothetical protein O3A81_02030 [bacterium]|nr:hypothetical protein [bacterium]
MKNTFKTTLVLLTVLLTACSSAPTQMEDVMDDHHKGEENIEPHGHEVDSAPKPPSRSNTVDDHDDTGTDPHGH